MTIAINCWILRNKKLDGIGYFTVNAITRLIKAHPEVHFQLLCDKKFSADYFNFPNASVHRIFPALRHPVVYVPYMEIVLPRFLRKHKSELLLSVDGFLSLRSRCPQLPVIHDINFEHNPKDLNFRNRVYYKFFFKRFARKAARIATVSEYSRKDIADYYKIDTGRIDNVSCGPSNEFSPLTPAAIENTRNKWSGGRPYFFFVGSMHPRKNIRRLIAAFNLFKKTTGSDMKLLLAGSLLWSKTEIEDAVMESGCQDDIVFTGRLSDEDLRQVLGSAFALSFVPVFEGFGMPIIEAMQCGVPVICSNVTSMPEVAGDAALLVDPFKIESIAAGMEQLATNNALREELIRKGSIRKDLFSWESTAKLLWDSIMKTNR